MKINGGTVKVIFDRARNYAQAINVLMITYLFLKESGWHWWYLGILVLLILLLIYDWYYVIAQERDTIWTRPGTLNDMREQIKEIHSRLVK